MPENRASAVFQTASHVLVVAAGLVYLFGFVVASISDANYGIADFSLFRTKVVAVGVLFTALLAFPILVTFRMFGIFGLAVKHADVFKPKVSPKNMPFHTLDVVLYIPFACSGITWLVSFLFASGPAWKPAGVGLWILLAMAMAAFDMWKDKAFDRHPLACVSVSFVEAVALFVILFKYSERSFLWTMTWMSLICVFTLQVFQEMRKKDEVRKTPWERLFLLIVPAIFGLYAIKVFPNIKHEYGGGAPIPIVLHLTKKLPPLDSEIVPVDLIDETEQGYYVLRGSDKAVFVARGLVEAVEFLRSRQTVQSPPVKP